MTARLFYLDKTVEEYFIKWQRGDYEKYYNCNKICGFDEYNLLLEFNHWVEPDDYDPIIDRTLTVPLPYQYAIDRVWQHPNSSVCLEDFFQYRTQQYIGLDKKINIFWSGGIDSTAMTVAFLNHCQDLSQLRIIYTEESVTEHSTFFSLLKTLSVELYKLTLHGALTQKLDGIYVNGMSLDERTAGISQKAFAQWGCDVLFRPWQDYFVKRSVASNFFDFFEAWFGKSTRPISNLLEARWWFYLQTKSQSQKYSMPRFVTQMFDQQNVNGFFYDCDQYDAYVYYNLEQVIQPGDTYHQHKRFLKQYIQKFDRNDHYADFSIKLNSVALRNIGIKVDLIKNQGWCFMLDDQSYHGTANLPLLSVQELEHQFGNTYDCVFNFGRSC